MLDIRTAASASLPRRRLSALVVLVAAVVLAACGGGAGATQAPGGGGGGAASQVPGGGGGSGTATQAPGGGGGSGTATQAPGGGGGGTLDACAYLTAADIQAVTGLAVKSSGPSQQFSIFKLPCGWVLVDDAAIVPPSIGLGMMTSGGRAYFDRHFAPYYDDFGYEPIEGLGDTAVDAGAGTVLVVSGDTLFDLQYLADQPDGTKVAAELAKKVVANLGR